MATETKLTTDTSGARSRLLYHYFTGLVALYSSTVDIPEAGTPRTAGILTPARRSIILGGAGSNGSNDPTKGDSGAQCGILGQIGLYLSDFYKGGFVSEGAYFAVTEIGLALLGDPIVPNDVDGTIADGDLVCSVAGTVWEKNTAIKDQIARAFFSSASLSIYQDGESCELWSTAIQNPAGLGLVSQRDAPNGMAIPSVRQPLKRPIVLEPKTTNGNAMLFELSFDGAPSVQQAPDYKQNPNTTLAAPEANSIVAQLVQMTLQGYLCKEDGTPIDDPVEQSIAGMFAKI